MDFLTNNIVIISIVFLLIVLIVVWKIKKRIDEGKQQHNFIVNTLSFASSQVETFNLASREVHSQQNPTAILQAVEGNELRLYTHDIVSNDWLGCHVEVYFSLRRDGYPVYYVFNSVVRKVTTTQNSSTIILSLPDELRVEKKRNFIRVKPYRDDVRVVGVWALPPGASLPHSASKLGTPLTRYRYGMKEVPVEVENISANGLALRIALGVNQTIPEEYVKGRQLLCLIVYVEDSLSQKPVIFWCSGEIMNSRIINGTPPQLIAGLEFINWAVLEPGVIDIHWSHSSPSRGVKPIMQWVKKMDRNRGRDILQSSEKAENRG